MKKYIASLIFCISCFSIFGQDKMDSIYYARIRPSLALSVFNGGNIDQWPQFSIAPSVSYKRHVLNLGMVFGPDFVLLGYHMPCSSNCAYDYLAFDLDQKHYSIHGVEMGYAYMLNERTAYKRYNNTKTIRKTNYYIEMQNLWTWHKTVKLIYPSDSLIFTKRRIQSIMGLSIERKIRNQLYFSMHLLGGIQFHKDTDWESQSGITTSYQSQRFHGIFEFSFIYKFH